uniref:Uncharacterized protein n=1 Tax=Arundo donax TaxID=35708 RepID=A0A0A8Y1E9_ARUDO
MDDSIFHFHGGLELAVLLMFGCHYATQCSVKERTSVWLALSS